MSVRSRRAPTRNFPIRRVILWLSIGAVGIAVLVSIAIANRSVPAASESAPAYNHLSVGQQAPPFAVTTTHGPISLSGTAKPIFLEVFATWCPHCQRETVVLNKLYERYKRRVAFVAVSGSAYAHDRTSAESLVDVLGFVRYFGVRYPVAFDGSLAVANAYLQGGYPTIAIIGSNKRIAYVGSGEASEAKLGAALDRALRTR